MPMFRFVDRSGSTWRKETVEIEGEIPLSETGYPIIPEHKLLFPRGFYRSKTDPLVYQTPVNTDEVNQAAGDVRTLVQQAIGAPKSKGREWWAWKCPLHNEQHGTAFSASESGWTCKGKCATGGDAIAWVMTYYGLDFESACESIMGSAPPPEQRRVINLHPEPTPLTPPPAEWQEAAQKVVDYGVHVLWSPEGAGALRYLREERGLEEWVIRMARIGYIPHRRYAGEWRELEGLVVPTGISIPWYSSKNLWAVNVRRAVGLTPKYLQFKGGHIKGALYGVDRIVPGLPLVFVEGEFDKWVAFQFIGDRANVVTLGGFRNELADHWLPYLKTAPRVYSLTDADEAGEKATEAVQAKRRDVQRLVIPTGKDISAFALQSRADAQFWLRSVIC